jgi:hypothetical protein
MVVQFNHTLVGVRDKHASAAYLAEMLGLPEPKTYGPFRCVELGNGASLDFVDVEDVHAQHYAFLVGEDDFDAILARIKERETPWWGDPFRRRPGEWNTDDGGRGLYWEEPDGHLLEIITRPYAVD